MEDLVKGIDNKDLVQAFEHLYENWYYQNSFSDSNGLYIKVSKEAEAIFSKLAEYEKDSI